MNIPRLQEDPDKRKLRIAREELDRLIAEHEGNRPQPMSREDVPDPVKVAMTFIQIYQQSTAPQCSKGMPFYHMFGGESQAEEQVVYGREPHPEEEYALSSACQLLADYFDRNNVSLQTARDTNKIPNKKDALVVVEDRKARRKGAE